MEVIQEIYANLPRLWTGQCLSLLSRFKRKKVLVDVATINDALGVPNPSNTTFEAKIRESNFKWEARVLALEC